MNKYIAEFLGTMILVFFGTGTAVVTGGFTGGIGAGFLGVMAIALAFGLTIVAGAYAIGHISGCHVNPAVSLGVLLAGRMSVKDFIGYVIAQVIGAFAGSGLLSTVVNSSEILHGYGADGYAALSAVGLSMSGAFIVETFLTFVFVLVILGVTASEKTSAIAGLVIGATLTMVHLIGIPLTGTSVNPARALAPAVFTGGEALSQVWLFIVAPLLGGAIAAVFHRAWFSTKEN
ncbi:aquaporin [Veillonella caviae]|uniref:aquaporin n=1 Tax=Veillonella caviae TaxID=248316 RepID=UPI000F8F7758|nr:aquaporin [Veillonella caviae]MCF0157645.1 aquaporin [Veillonella sp.]MCI5708049.1 aquaporin [Veillonella caviae]MCI7694511.1 aquaporin [Veillonella caviae]MDD7290521.1 aquaporin [Veillonella caviae]MDY4746286.1 aquaporin [Veillonella caviae]